MSKKMTERDSLEQVYLYVVDEWAVYAGDIANALELSVSRVQTLLNKLGRAGLLASEHVNGERKLMWQSYYSIQDGESREDAQRDFAEAFPGEPETKKAHGTGGGPRYTPEQIALGVKRTVEGATAKAVAAEVGVKSPNYFRKVVKAEIERVAVENAKRGKKSARVAKRVVKRVRAAD